MERRRTSEERRRRSKDLHWPELWMVRRDRRWEGVISSERGKAYGDDEKKDKCIQQLEEAFLGLSRKDMKKSF